MIGAYEGLIVYKLKILNTCKKINYVVKIRKLFWNYSDFISNKTIGGIKTGFRECSGSGDFFGASEVI